MESISAVVFIFNSGDIAAGDDGKIYAFGNALVSNEGDITADLDGIYIEEGGIVTNEGTIDAQNDGIAVEDDGAIITTGDVSGGETGIRGGDGDQFVVIDATVQGGTNAVDTAGGDDEVRTTSTASISGDVQLW